MDVETGAMASLRPKLVELLNDKYKLQGSIRQDIEYLSQEIGSLHAYLLTVADVPREKVNVLDRDRTGRIRKLSYEIEVDVDKFLRSNDSEGFKRLIEKTCSLVNKGKTRRQIFTSAINNIKAQVQQITELRERYRVDDATIRYRYSGATIDPRILFLAMYADVNNLVGIDGKRDQELMKLLSDGGNVPSKKLKIVSVVGFGGLGKTILVKTVYGKIKSAFECSAFVSVGQNPDVKKVLMNIIFDLGMYGDQLTKLDEQELIEKLRELLENKRYLIVIDDIWNEMM